MTQEFSKYRVLTFDCYGTLIDWKAGVLGALEDHLELDQDVFFGTWWRGSVGRSLHNDP